MNLHVADTSLKRTRFRGPDIVRFREVSLYCKYHCVKSIRIRSYSGSYFPAFGLNTERYGVYFRIQSECGKIGTVMTPNTDTLPSIFLTASHLHHHQFCLPRLASSVNLLCCHLCTFYWPLWKNIYMRGNFTHLAVKSKIFNPLSVIIIFLSHDNTSKK